MKNPTSPCTWNGPPSPEESRNVIIRVIGSILTIVLHHLEIDGRVHLTSALWYDSSDREFAMRLLARVAWDI